MDYFLSYQDNGKTIFIKQCFKSKLVDRNKRLCKNDASVFLTALSVIMTIN